MVTIIWWRVGAVWWCGGVRRCWIGVEPFLGSIDPCLHRHGCRSAVVGHLFSGIMVIWWCGGVVVWWFEV